MTHEPEQPVPGAPLIDEGTFLSVMSSFPSGVTVVTTLGADSRPIGLTCTATCSVSRTPPMLLVCINRGSRVLRAILERGFFAVNFLRNDRDEVASRFAGRLPDRFTAARWRPSEVAGLPWLPDDTIAFAECRVATVVEGGDHLVLLGVVVGGRAEGGAASPLMYWRSTYGRWPIEDDTGVAAVTLAAEG
ncbi:flavin reductase family protein [Amycolatopsis sp. NPDC049688]|uniref:flavin reductase family protein n=1 Tax=Amycolatopsis sp. NPDC049688 TaxID=3154733 RepID=UPI00344935DF